MSALRSLVSLGTEEGISKKHKNVRICRAKLDEEELLQWQAIYGLKRANIDIVRVW
jgi:hypothetical protein